MAPSTPVGHPVFAVLSRWRGALGDRTGFAEGTVVEIGAGTGLNFRHYPAGVEVLATEPDPHILKAARKAARGRRRRAPCGRRRRRRCAARHQDHQPRHRGVARKPG